MSFNPFSAPPPRYRSQGGRSASFSTPTTPATFATTTQGSYSTPTPPASLAPARSASFSTPRAPARFAMTTRASHSAPKASPYTYQSKRSMGQGVEPPPVQGPNWALALGWIAVVGATVGIFYGVTSDRGFRMPMRANRPKRRSSRRRRPRRNSRRRSSRRRGRRVLANTLSDADAKFAKKIAMAGIPRSKAAMNKTKAQIRKRLPPPNEAEIKLWNKGNVSERSGSGISKAMEKYAKRTGLPKWAVTYVLQLGWQNTRGNLSLR